MRTSGKLTVVVTSPPFIERFDVEIVWFCEVCPLKYVVHDAAAAVSGIPKTRKIVNAAPEATPTPLDSGVEVRTRRNRRPSEILR